ncbi:PDZ domain-containing protein [Sorangium sp. So ce136]|uniref:PDZ domain-containing protein n=1 Tax=Sorangium sp. So ce136 TaxID=3133284 RepID=UPI003F113087
MHGSQQRDRSLGARGAYGWARRLSGVLTPLVPLALAACRGDCPRVEATQRAEATERRADAPASPSETAKSETAKAEKPAGPAPTMITVAAPWYLTLQPTSGPGARIASMDIRSFAAPLLEPGDVILAVDGRPVHSTAGLEGYLRACTPGDMVVLTVLRSETTINYAMLQVPDGGAPKPPPAGVAEHAGPAGGG